MPRRLLLPSLLLVLACGEGTTDPDANGVPEWVQVTVGSDHACALTREGEAFCWGAGDRGQLGRSSLQRSPVPVAVSGGHRFALVEAAGGRTCGLTVDGATLCWGANDLRQLGNGSPFDAPAPTPLAGDPSFDTLAVGPYFGCGVRPDGSLLCWGAARFDALFGGQPPGECLGSGGPMFWICSPEPVPVLADHRFRSLSVGLYHACGLLEDGAAVCWGEDRLEQLGAPAPDTCVNQIEFPCARAPVSIDGDPGLVEVRAGAAHTCGRTATGEGWCWGAAALHFGQLGTPADAGAEAPVAVEGSHVFRELAPSTENHIHGFTCGVTTDGRGLCWGANADGQLGTSTPGTCNGTACSAVPAELTGAPELGSIRTGDRFACAVTAGDEILCWGRNEAGQLGDGTTAGRATPAPIAPPF